MWTKICGVTTLESAHAVIDAGVSAVGLNFFTGSKRFVSVSAAAEIAEVIRGKGTENSIPDMVGVFVNSQVADITRTADEVGLTAIQFHGDETPERLSTTRSTA
ncbi:MAG: hypothetical protein U0936_05595 [Planctomycetaceae bacterium]